MMAELRRQANETAQAALHAANEHLFRTGHRNRLLDARYSAAERLLDLIDAQIEAEQVGDPQAPDYFGIFLSEAEARDWFGADR